jgi:hypothetical protein
LTATQLKSEMVRGGLLRKERKTAALDGGKGAAAWVAAVIGDEEDGNIITRVFSLLFNSVFNLFII